MATNHIEGRIRLTFVVDQEGHVEPGSLAVVTSSDTGFVAAAFDAVLRSRFRPGTLAGKAVPTRVEQVIVFHIEP